jgi:DNA modification methylase
MGKAKKTVAENRNYSVLNVRDAKEIALVWLKGVHLENAVEFGLPEIDDRYHVWRVPLVMKYAKRRVGEVVIDARSSLILLEKSTDAATLEARLLGRKKMPNQPQTVRKSRQTKKDTYELSDLRNTIALGNSENILHTLPANSIDLVFTSPPYYNARREYADYITYEEYLLNLRKVIQATHHVLAEGRFFVINVAPVLIRRASRSESSRRIAVPFDLHRIFIEEGFDFIDDIIWVKPSGAGWATGRGRRFAADRNPLQYKAVPITEYVLVYRKYTSRLIDWNIRAHPDQNLVKESQIDDNYESMNVWHIQPAHDKRHPAVFPLELAERVIRYYSFKQDVVLDPFAGIGTVGKAASRLQRRFVLIEREKEYVDIIREEAKQWLGKNARNILTLNCAPINPDDMLF